jgi:hypothetical protein
MEPPRDASPFKFDPEANFNQGVTTRSKTKANKKKTLLSKSAGGLSLTELPNEMQSCVFTFLSRDDLARCSAVNRACRSIATLDDLWEPFPRGHSSMNNLAPSR